MTDENDYKEQLGEKSAFTSTFQRAIQLMIPEQLTALLDDVSNSLEAAESVCARNPSSLLLGMIDSYRRIQFRVRQQLDLTEGNGPRSQEFEMICIKCEIPVSALNDYHCIMCGSIEWVEVDHVAPPSEPVD